MLAVPENNNNNNNNVIFRFLKNLKKLLVNVMSYDVFFFEMFANDYSINSSECFMLIKCQKSWLCDG